MMFTARRMPYIVSEKIKNIIFEGSTPKQNQNQMMIAGGEVMQNIKFINFVPIFME